MKFISPAFSCIYTLDKNIEKLSLPLAVICLFFITEIVFLKSVEEIIAQTGKWSVISIGNMKD